jgi:hypothetical protein
VYGLRNRKTTKVQKGCAINIYFSGICLIWIVSSHEDRFRPASEGSFMDEKWIRKAKKKI